MARPINQKTIPEREQPISERFRLAGEAWADADGAASLLEELKTTVLEQRKTKVIEEHFQSHLAAAPEGELVSIKEMPENKAERIVKADPEWETYIRQMCAARAHAGKLRVKMEAIRMEFSEWQSKDANARQEQKMNRGHA